MSPGSYTAHDSTQGPSLYSIIIALITNDRTLETVRWEDRYLPEPRYTLSVYNTLTREKEESEENDIVAYLNSLHIYLFREKEKFSHQERTIAEVQDVTEEAAKKTAELANLPQPEKVITTKAGT